MELKELKDDLKFRQKCVRYNLDFYNYKIYKDYICLESIYNNLIVIFDKKYNIVGVKRKDNSLEETRLLQEIIGKYENDSNNILFGGNFGYKLERFTLKNITDISDRIDIEESNAYSVILKINGLKYELEYDNEYFELLSYIKFLGNEIKYYYETFYPLMMLSHNIPDIYSYIRSISDKINWHIEETCKSNDEISPSDILDILGRKTDDINEDLLHGVVNLFTRLNGYRIEKSTTSLVEELEKNVLGLLEATDDEIKLNETYNGKVVLDKDDLKKSLSEKQNESEKIKVKKF